jgi:outer membrane lipoprotein-sorting protein
MNKYLICITAAAAVCLLGCQEKGAAAKAGERMDEVVDNVKRGDAPLKEKGAMEKMGDSIDDTLKSEDKK